ncbi:MAG: hypothetical protein LBC19_14065 [Tannerella sp.]|jgi:hypothetical protein|nr:hypothetical protein [Tannerella sp.]
MTKGKSFFSILMILSVIISSFAQENRFSGTSVILNGTSVDANMAHSQPLIDFGKEFSSRDITLNDAEIKLLKKGEHRFLQVRLGYKDEHPSVTLPIPMGMKLSEYVAIAMDITNKGIKSIAIEAQCYSEKDPLLTIKDGAAFYYRSMIVLNPGETDTLMILLSRSMDSLPKHIQNHFTGMFGLPGGFVRRKINLDLDQLTHLSIFKQHTDEDWTVTIDNIRAVGKYSLPDEATLKNRFFPFIDRFGQYMHSDWPYKAKTLEDIQRQRIEEEQDIARNPKPTAWNRYGGWENGPTLKATGHFRVEKYNGKWWLVDPAGKLFWSQGLNIVTITQRTQIRGREKYFSYTPFYDDFYLSNLMIKYNGSPTLFNDATAHIHKRLRSWGMNTIAANSNAHFYTHPQTPYAIEIRSGLPGRLPEDFDAETFKKSFREVLVKQYRIEDSANDPWCIGYFVDNEYAWPENNQQEVIYNYFRTVREVLNEFAPKKLYLGCRSNSVNFNRTAFEAAAEYCDVISINHYDYNLSDFKETKGLYRPLIVGEYHYGALDRGMPHPGLRSTSSQKQRARVYKHFVDQALANEFVVGTHWFQYLDQLYTGRSDGENYQIGFVDICDRPHQEMIEASREIASYMYNYRHNGEGHTE